MKKERMSTVKMAQLGLLIAIELLLAFTPLGSILIGPVVATIAHIPVIIAAVLLGTGSGAFMGFVFGFLSFIVFTFMPPAPTAFVFTPFYSVGDFHGNLWSLVICFVPRILVGVVAGVTFKAISKFDSSKYIAYISAALLGSLVNTVLVLGGIYIFFGHQYSQVINQSYDMLLGLIMTVIFTNGIPEAILAAVLTVVIAKPISKYIIRGNYYKLIGN